MELVQKLIDIEDLLTRVEMDVEKAWAMCNELDQDHFSHEDDNLSVSRIENDIALEHTHTARERLKQVDAPAQEKQSKREAEPARGRASGDDQH